MNLIQKGRDFLDLIKHDPAFFGPIPDYGFQKMGFPGKIKK